MYDINLTARLTQPSSGLGVMGYPMAVNLRRKIGSDITVIIYDINREAVERYQNSMGDEHGPVEVASNAAEAVKAAVSIPCSHVCSYLPETS